MTAEELINQMIPPLKTSDSAQKALDWMEKLRILQLPVVDGSEYKGILTEDVVLDHMTTSETVGDFPLIGQQVHAFQHNHFYDVLKMALENDLHIIPVVDQNKQYFGAISVNETASTLARMFAGQGPGGILVISISPNDYSMSEISRLIESNDAKILSSFYYTEEDPNTSKLTIKLNKEDLSRIIATLERHNYKVVAHFHESDLIDIDKERLDLLFKYLNL
jgi:acetoin utilization protein AcuB